MTSCSYQFETPAFALVEGADALRYMNARLSQHIQSGAGSPMQDAAALNSKGRCEAYFHIISLEDRWFLYQDNDLEANALPAFKQFLVADQVSVTDCCQEYRLYHITDPAPDNLVLPKEEYDVVRIKESFIVRYTRLGTTGYDLIVHTNDTDSFSKVLQDSKQLNNDDFQLLRMKQGSLAFPDEINDRHFFLESGLTHSYSTEKGCYVGQEAVEMSLARGKLPAAVMRFTLQGTHLEPGDKILDLESTPIGTVLSCISETDTQHCFGFARIRKADTYEGIIPMQINEQQGTLSSLNKGKK